MKNVLGKNSDYGTFCSIYWILMGKSFNTFNIEELTAGGLVHFKYALTVSVDV
jgi:hypothetical protein